MSPGSDLIEKAKLFHWYHALVVPGTNYTTEGEDYVATWNHTKRFLEQIVFRGKSVLDMGCRDGLFSFFAEDFGATRVVAADSDKSEGGAWIAKLKQSKVKFERLSVYDSLYHNEFDVTLFLGVLYHLRFPFFGLHKVVRGTKLGGTIVVESGFLPTEGDADKPLLFCPVDPELYDLTSCTFFNSIGLDITMKSFGCSLVNHSWSKQEEKVFRGIRQYKKTNAAEVEADYWFGYHTYHTKKNYEDCFKQIRLGIAE